jgi:hypothetical protein
MHTKIMVANILDAASFDNIPNFLINCPMKCKNQSSSSTIGLYCVAS